MILSGKCKKEFERWYEDPKRDHVGLRRKVQWFYTLSFAMQYGVLVDFFDSVDLEMYIQKYVKKYQVFMHFDGNSELNGYFETLNEARTEAIKKANELYNEKFK